VDSSGLLSARASAVLDDSAQLAGGLFAVVCCVWLARRAAGVRRSWRRLMAIGMVGWTVGQLIWSWYQVFASQALPSPSTADVGYLIFPVFGLFALLTVAAEGLAERRRERSALRYRLVLVLDGLMVVGSLLALTWATALGAVVGAEASSTFAFAVAVAYPVTDLILVVMVVLLLVTKPVPARLRPELGLLGLGLVGLSASDSIFAYVVASGGSAMPPIANAGFIAGPVLVGLAALTPARPENARPRAVIRRSVQWAHLMLPYLPLAATGVLVMAHQMAGQQEDAFEVYLGIVVVALVVGRQMITLVDNNMLLGRVVDAQQRLHHQAYHDPLTGLANRALFRSRLATAVELNRHGRRSAALFFVDLDDFKMVNDSLGHSAGDRLLQAVGERLLSCVRGGDTVGRLGGDEFGVLAGGDIGQPDRLGQRILTALREPFDLDGRPVTVGASVGAAVPDSTEAGLTADALLRRADAAMYAGKRRGKGLFVVYGPDTVAAYDNPDLPTLLAEALGGETNWAGLEVHYQPIVRMSDGGPVAIEALARWTHPLIGSIPPAVFVAMAERAGLISALDDFVLDRSCRELAATLARRGGDMSLHVNISASRLGNVDLEDRVGEVLDRHALKPRHLVLEVTETSRIPDPRAAAASAERLRATGVRLALDDFGAGYNTVAQLHLLPLDIVKLDLSLTAGAGHAGGARTEALCRSVVTIAAELGIAVVAEGVETPEQAAALTRVGCGYGQGFLYGGPTPRMITV
jgi:diguanylate cyclase (GGDEF)-like protein